MKPGDKVTFHMIPAHICAGGKEAECRCIHDAAVQLDAEVIAVHELEGKLPQALELEVAMPPDVLALGYATRQSYSYQATTVPPESGTWTVRN